MIPISKEEAHKLNKSYKVNFGENGISRTHSKRKKYYLTVNRYNMYALNEIRGIKPRKNKPNFRNKRVGV